MTGARPSACASPWRMTGWSAADSSRLTWNSRSTSEASARETPAPGEEWRVGVCRTSDFYRRFTGLDHPPETLQAWLRRPEPNLATCTNGKVFPTLWGHSPVAAGPARLLSGGYSPQKDRLPLRHHRPNGTVQLPAILETGRDFFRLLLRHEVPAHAISLASSLQPPLCALLQMDAPRGP